LLDVAAAYAKVPLLALIAIREASGEVNGNAWGQRIAHPYRDRIIEHSKAHSFSEADFAAVAEALARLDGLGNKTAWKHVRASMPRAELYRVIAGLERRGGVLQKELEIEEDVREVERRRDLGETEKKALIPARRSATDRRRICRSPWSRS
jgi:hypothetical protein